MASPNEPLLSSSSSSTPRRISLPCKALLLTLPVAAILSLLAIYSPSSFHLQQQLLHPSNLCTNSPNPSSCLTILSSTAFTSTARPTKISILNTIIDQSRLHLDTAIAAANGLHGTANSAMQRAALTDCLQLMDLSRDHLATAASSSSPSDARTWLSAVLANHVTCLDGLDGPAKLALEDPIKSLMSLTSASLAVLSTEGNDVVKPIVDFPSWVSHRDRKLLQEATSVNAITANVVVAQDGSGKFKTVQQAVDAAPAKSNARYVIYVKKGTYKETVRLDKTKTNIMIAGDGMDATIITGSLNFIDGTTTFNSATLAAVGTGLILQDLRVQNTAGAAKHQAVALRVGADQAVINRCRLDGYQDTLYTHSLRQFYRDCVVSGTVDFIFGDAAVVLQNCNIVINKPLSNQKNTITAQGRTDPNENTGISIQKCTVKASADLAPVIKSIASFLGRPWKLYSRTVFMQTYLDSSIYPKGWLEWDGDFALKTLYYGEYQNTGPGAGTSGRVTWPGYDVITDAKKASAFTVASLIQGGNWLKNTGVTYTEGL